MSGMPRRITISEVGPRDGLQIERTLVPAAVKIGLIERLVAAGIDRIEVSAFVHPKVVPQMADAEEVFAGLQRRPGVRYGALVFNTRGAARAIASGVDELKVGMAASDSFNELNVKMTTEQGMRSLDEIAALARGTRCQLVGAISTAFGCPYEGPVQPAKVHRMFEQLAGFGVPVIYLADTTGVADPGTVRRTLEDLTTRWPRQPIGLHFHNTRGLGLANALAGLEFGVVDFESSVGGLGGCPFAPRAVGNISTEDFVHMAHAMGIETGVDLDALIDAARFAQDALGRTLPGMVMKAGKATELHAKDAPRMKVD